MKCSQCGAALALTVAQLAELEPTSALPVTFHTQRKRIRLWFCSPACAWWGGVLFARSGSPTTVVAVRRAFNGRVQVL